MLEMFEIEPKSRTHHRLVFGRLQGQGPSTEQTEARLTSLGILYFRHHLSAPALYCLCNLIRCNIVCLTPAVRRPAYQRILLRGGRRRKLYVLGDAQAVSWVGVIGGGGRAGVYRKRRKTCAYRFFTVRFHVLLGFCSERGSSPLMLYRLSPIYNPVNLYSPNPAYVAQLLQVPPIETFCSTHG